MSPNTRLLLSAVAAGALGIVAGVGLQGGRVSNLSSQPQPTPVPSHPAPAERVTPAKPGAPLPALTLPDLDGNPVALRELAAGRPLLINIWASWCKPCAQEIPELSRFAITQGDRGIQVVGLALDTPENVHEFLRRIPVHYSVVVAAPGPADASVQLGDSGGVLPYSVLISRDGYVVKQKLGPFIHGEIDSWTSTSTKPESKIQTSD